jgi:hypothetical protein
MDELRTYVGVTLTADQLTSVMSSSDAGAIGGLVSYLSFSDPADLAMDHVPSTTCGEGSSTAVGPTTGKVCGIVAAAGGVALDEGGCCPIVVDGDVTCDQVGEVTFFFFFTSSLTSCLSNYHLFGRPQQ